MRCLWAHIHSLPYPHEVSSAGLGRWRLSVHSLKPHFTVSSSPLSELFSYISLLNLKSQSKCHHPCQVDCRTTKDRDYLILLPIYSWYLAQCLTNSRLGAPQTSWISSKPSCKRQHLLYPITPEDFTVLCVISHSHLCVCCPI
jgi:hypothetical protein